MALKISKKCINCDMCEPECPNQAISFDGTLTVIDPARCTECKGHYEHPTCVAVCPIDCIDPDPMHLETDEQLYDKFVALHGAELIEHFKL